ncbi:MAG TPA: thiol:disulfide interchange protein DsbA/DsbL [Povalibacter sp.]|jgi:thiol:disulfide interchange protein DsbA|nr:thiol:disulfide interchange protein DsbA/DsbL [Povalibacter sp.]
MRLLCTLIVAAVGLSVTHANAAERWVEGKNYFLVQPAQRTSVGPGKVEVAEAFSYGCPACNQFVPVMAELKKRLPPQAQIVYVHASFNTAESWPLFQRSYYTALQLGITDKTHEAMFRSIWGHNAELAVVENGRIKKPAPTIEDVARVYARVAGVDANKVVAMSKSFVVDSNMRRADAWMKACQVDQTPTLVINGKYRLHVPSAGGVDQLYELVDFLVRREIALTSASR